MNETAEDLLLRAAKEVAPNEEVKLAFEKMYDAMVQDGVKSNNIIQQLAAAILDGLRYSNWPK